MPCHAARQRYLRVIDTLETSMTVYALYQRASCRTVVSHCYRFPTFFAPVHLAVVPRENFTYTIISARDITSSRDVFKSIQVASGSWLIVSSFHRAETSFYSPDPRLAIPRGEGLQDIFNIIALPYRMKTFNFFIRDWNYLFQRHCVVTPDEDRLPAIFRF